MEGENYALWSCEEYTEAIKLLEQENDMLRQALRLMHHAKSKSEFKRLCTQAGIDWAELIREEK